MPFRRPGQSIDEHLFKGVIGRNMGSQDGNKDLYQDKDSTQDGAFVAP